MARGVNLVILVGHAGRDPEMRSIGSGQVTNVTIATTESWKDKNTGEKHEKTEWHRLVFFGRLAEIAGQYVKKGSQIYVEGRLRTNKWQDKNGQDRYTTEIVVNNLQLLGRASGNTATAPEQGSASAEGPAPAQGGRPDNSTKAGKSGDDYFEDIPFLGCDDAFEMRGRRRSKFRL